jgi:hypothetical protein
MNANTERRTAGAAAAAMVAILIAAAGPARAGDEGTLGAGRAAAGSAWTPGIRQTSGPAEYHLAALASSSRRSRKLAGGLGLAVGAACVGGGLAIMHDMNDESTEDPWNIFAGFGYLGGAVIAVSGGVAMAGGIVSMSSTTPAEKRYARVLAIEDPLAREAASALALSGLAKRGKRARAVRAAIYGGLGLVGALSASGSDGQGSNLTLAACGGGLAALSLLTKSRAEKAYLAYEQEKGPGISPEIILGVGPRGGFRAGVSLDF